MKKQTIVIGISFWLLSINSLLAQDLQLVLRLDHRVFFESQGIWANLALINRGENNREVQPLVLSDDISRGIRFILTKPSGAQMEASGGVTTDSFEPESARTINRLDSIASMYNLITWLSTNDDTGANHPPYLSTMHYLKSGSYTLQARQLIGKDTLRSNVVRFSVKTPQGRELKALRALRDADRKYAQNLRDITSAVAYERIVRSFPKSVYVPYAFYRLIFIYSYLRPQQNHAKAFDLITTLCESFPNDDQSVDLLYTYSSVMIKEGRRDILEKLARRYPSSKVGRLSLHKLQQAP